MQNSEFHERLKEARVAKSYSQTELARIADVAPGQINRYEAGKNVPRVHILARLAGALGVHREWLEKGTGPRETGTVTAYGNMLDVTTVARSGGGFDVLVDLDDEAHEIFSKAAAEAEMPLGEYLKKALLERAAAARRRREQAGAVGVDLDDLARRVKDLIVRDDGKPKP